MPNCEHTALLLLGIMASGLVANPINLMSQPSQLRHVLWHSDARLVFTTSDRADTVRTLLAELDRPVQLVVVDTLGDDLPVFSPITDCGSASADGMRAVGPDRSEEHTSELQSLMRISYAVFCLK